VEGDKVSEQEINEAIALACGWIYYDGWHHPDGRGEVPNYCTDLNAMAQAVKTLDINDLCRYIDELDKICVPVHICHYTRWIAVVEASARQRSEAFLRTIGKWKEESK